MMDSDDSKGSCGSIDAMIHSPGRVKTDKCGVSDRIKSKNRES